VINAIKKNWRVKTMTIQESLLINEVSEVLLEFGEINKDELTTSDYQSIAMVKAMKIIKLIERR
jgi:hypothetical protein